MLLGVEEIPSLDSPLELGCSGFENGNNPFGIFYSRKFERKGKRVDADLGTGWIARCC